MDIKEIITSTIQKITSDEKLREKFMKDPVKTVEELTGVDLPDDAINKVVDGVKAKLTADKLGGLLGKFTK